MAKYKNWDFVLSVWELSNQYFFGMITPMEITEALAYKVEEALDSFKKKVMTIARGLAMDAGTDIDKDIVWVGSIYKKREYRDAYIFSKGDTVGIFFLLYLLSHMRTRQSNTVFDVVWVIFCSLQFFPICSSWLYTYEEVERGIGIDLHKAWDDAQKQEK